MRPRLAVLILVTLSSFSWQAAATTPLPAPLRIATTRDYPPFSFLDEGAPRGFDVLMAERLGRDLARPIAFTTVRWPDLLHQGRAGAFDIAMSGITVRGDRLPVFAFTRPYALTGAVAVVRPADRDRLRSREDLDRPGVRLAVNAGGHLERVARRLFPRATIEPVDDNTSLATRLRGGSVDAVISDSAEARAWRPYGFVALGPFTRDRKAYAVPLGRADLIPALDAWLAARESDGFVDAQRRTWLGADASQSADDMCLEALASAVETRLGLMPYVAAVKHRDGLPITDLRQEARVLDGTRAAARQAGLDPRRVRALVRRLIRQSKAIQRAAPLVTDAGSLDLGVLRLAVRTASAQLIAELARCQGALHEPGARARLRQALAPIGTALPVPDHALAGLAAALQRAGAGLPARISHHGGTETRRTAKTGFANWFPGGIVSHAECSRLADRVVRKDPCLSVSSCLRGESMVRNSG